MSRGVADFIGENEALELVASGKSRANSRPLAGAALRGRKDTSAGCRSKDRLFTMWQIGSPENMAHTRYQTRMLAWEPQKAHYSMSPWLENSQPAFA
jgi:hypothetical protein